MNHMLQKEEGASGGFPPRDHYMPRTWKTVKMGQSWQQMETHLGRKWRWMLHFCGVAEALFMK